MSERTGIKWCDSTFNPWWGCTEVTAGCDNCYAKIQAARLKGMSWGKGAPRIRTSPSNWKEPLKWDKKAEAEHRMHKVFAASMADIFDMEVDRNWRNDFVSLTFKTKSTWWLLLTKRPAEAVRSANYCHRYTWIGTSVTGNKDIPMARTIVKAPGAVRWLSYEPALEHLDVGACPRDIDWYVVGGESGPNARPFHMEWARDVVEKCHRYGKKVFVKQLGAKPFLNGIPWPITDSHGANMNEWPEDLRVQEFPEPALPSDSPLAAYKAKETIGDLYVAMKTRKSKNTDTPFDANVEGRWDWNPYLKEK